MLKRRIRFFFIIVNDWVKKVGETKINYLITQRPHASSEDRGNENLKQTRREEDRK